MYIALHRPFYCNQGVYCFPSDLFRVMLVPPSTKVEKVREKFVAACEKELDGLGLKFSIGTHVPTASHH